MLEIIISPDVGRGFATPSIREADTDRPLNRIR